MIYVVALGQIMIQTCLAPQNDCQHLSFVKGAYVAGKEMTRNGRKIAKFKGCLFFKWPVFTCKKLLKTIIHKLLGVYQFL